MSNTIHEHDLTCSTYSSRVHKPLNTHTYIHTHKKNTNTHTHTQQVSNEADLFKAMEKHTVGEVARVRVLRIRNSVGNALVPSPQSQEELTFTLKLSAMTNTFNN